MFAKRFYLPCNADISKYETGIHSIDACLCGHYNHICCVFRCGSTKQSNILAYGMNLYGDLEGKCPGIHAEYAAITKLPRIRKEKKRLERIDICVIRLSKTKKIQCSKPCYNCIQMLCVYPNSKGYQVCNVYYSNGDGGITRTTLARLLREEEQHFSRYYTKRYREIQNKDIAVV
jgi:cytidine deaminase